MSTETNVERFVDAQAGDYSRALAEIKNGRKQSHWMWYVFPQIAGLGFSEMAKFYAIRDVQEARTYLDHPILGSRLIEIANALLSVEGRSATQIMGSPDDIKLRSSMTLFGALSGTDSVFQAVIDNYFNGQPDQRTLAMMKNN